MALTTDIRIFPQKEMFAVDMAEILDATIPRDGIIQGCEITFNSTAGTLSVESGRIMLHGRLGVVTESGELAAPVVTGSADVTCYLVAACNLSTLNPFSVEIITPATYEEYQQLKSASGDDFNTHDGFDFFVLGTVVVNPTSGKITTWTPSADINAKKAMKAAGTNSGGTKLSSGTNIDNLTKVDSGWWAYTRSEVSGTFPLSDTYGTIGHVQGIDSNSAMQFLRSGGQSYASSVLWVRFKNGGTWGNWLRYISPVNVNLSISRINNPYCSANDLSELAASKKNGWLHLRGNLRISSAIPNQTMNVHVATISGWTTPRGEYLNVPHRYGEDAIRVTVSSDGKIYISNYSSATYGEFFFSLTVPTSDGYE